jgi:hypothetical protein
VRVGLNGRFFPSNWRPPADELRFAEAHGFDAIQVRVDPPATIDDVLRERPPAGGGEWVVELLLRASTGIAAADAVRANLDAIHARRCSTPCPVSRSCGISTTRAQSTCRPLRR